MTPQAKKAYEAWAVRWSKRMRTVPNSRDAFVAGYLAATRPHGREESESEMTKTQPKRCAAELRIGGAVIVCAPPREHARAHEAFIERKPYRAYVAWFGDDRKSANKSRRPAAAKRRKKA